MISVSDLLHLPFTPDLIEGGIAYAVRSLPYTYDRMGGSPFDRLRRIVAGVAVELAFRRYLSEHNVPYDVKGATPFTDPDRYDVSLGGHRCDVKSFLITHRDQISEMRRDPGIVLKAPALVPSEQHAAQGHGENDLYLFAFLSGVAAASQADVKKAIEADQRVNLVHVMPKSWSKPQTWIPLGRLALKSESDAALTVELSGQDEGRGFLTRSVVLPPQTRVELEDPFFALSCVHLHTGRAASSGNLPGARIGIHSPIRKETHLIAPLEWGNIWVYGMDILLTGYLTRDEFRRRARLINPGTRVFQYNRTRTKNLAVLIADLKPLGDLFEQVKAWEANRS